MYYLLIERSGNAFLLFILFILCFYKKNVNYKRKPVNFDETKHKNKKE